MYVDKIKLLLELWYSVYPDLEFYVKLTIFLPIYIKRKKFFIIFCLSNFFSFYLSVFYFLFF